MLARDGNGVGGGAATKAGLGGVEATRTLEVRRGRAGKEEHAETPGVVGCFYSQIDTQRFILPYKSPVLFWLISS